MAKRPATLGNAWLVVVRHGPEVELLIRPWDHTAAIGSRPDADYCFALPWIAPAHATLRRHRGAVRLSAQGSTWVDDKLVDGTEVKLVDNALIRLGATLIRYEAEPARWTRIAARHEPVDPLTGLPFAPRGRAPNLRAVLPADPVIRELAFGRLAKRLVTLASGEARVLATARIGELVVDGVGGAASHAIAARLAVEGSLQTIDVGIRRDDHRRIAIELQA